MYLSINIKLMSLFNNHFQSLNPEKLIYLHILTKAGFQKDVGLKCKGWSLFY